MYSGSSLKSLETTVLGTNTSPPNAPLSQWFSFSKGGYVIVRWREAAFFFRSQSGRNCDEPPPQKTSRTH